MMPLRFRGLRSAVRMRVFADAALRWVPLALLLGFVVGGLSAWPYGLAVGALGTLVVVVLAFREQRRFDDRWLVRRLDAQRPDLEDSSDLLLADAASLGPLQRLQRQRLEQRLETRPAPDLRPPWSVPGILAAWLLLVAVVAASLWLPGHGLHPGPVPTPVPATAAAAPGVPQLVASQLRTVPPRYTGLPERSDSLLDARAPAGSGLHWRLRFAPQPQAAELLFHDGRAIPLQRDGEDWVATMTLTESTLYRVVPIFDGEAPLPPLSRLEAIVDQVPQVNVIVPGQSLTMMTPGQRRWALQFEASDDYGVSGQATLQITLAQGTGENVRFSESSLPVRGTGEATRRVFAVTLDLDGYGLEEGDDVVVQLAVSDNRAPAPQSALSPSVILRWPVPAPPDLGDLEGVVRQVLPAYFRSQRQIIIDAEALLQERPRLAEPEFTGRSDALGVDQRILRLRYGQFLGEESEGGPRPPPTNDDHAGEDSHDHAADEGHGHDHGPEEGETVAPFGSAIDVLEEWGHTHDIPEAATLLDPETREVLRQALGEMWQSELHLRQARPDLALPYANKALEYIKQVQEAERIYLQRTGPELPPVDESRRLGGDREGLARRSLPSLGARPSEALAEDTWRSLASGVEASPDAAGLAELQRWVDRNRARIDDPLSMLAAIDAVQADPACDDCRQRLRAQLWTVLERPAAHAPLREAPTAIGERYFDALGAEGEP